MVDKMWKIVLSVTLLTGLIVGIGYLVSGEEKRELSKLMDQLAQTSIAEFTGQIDRVRDVDTVLLVVAGRGNRDEEEQFREMLVDAVQDSSKYRVRTWEYVKKTLDDSVLTTFLQQIGMVPGQEPNSLKRAIESVTLLAERANMDIDGVLFVDVVNFTEGNNKDGLGARIALEGSVYSLPSKKIVSTIGPVKHEITSAWDIRYVRHTLDETSWLLRFLGWFAVAAALPWVFIQVVRGVVKKRNNSYNIAILVLFTLVDMLLGWLLLSGLAPITSGAAIATLLGVMAVMGYYNYDACDYIERRLL